MIAKYLAIFVIASVVGQGLPHVLPEPRSLVEITLADEFINHITNDLIGRGFGIAKNFWDSLESCHVIFPNGLMYEAFPSNQLPAGPLMFLEAVQPFVSCSVGIRGADVSMSGTYELVSVVQHNLENYRSMTRQRFHLNLIASDPN